MDWEKLGARSRCLSLKFTSKHELEFETVLYKSVVINVLRHVAILGGWIAFFWADVCCAEPFGHLIPLGSWRA